MLARLPIVALGLALAGAPTVAAVCTARSRTATEWRGGVMLRGTLHGDRFTIAQQWPESRRVEVVFEGELPDNVCEEVAVAIEGRWAGDHFEAAQVVADRSKYDACWEWQCRPDHERPAGCRRRHRFE